MATPSRSIHRKWCELVADLKTPGGLLIERYLAWTAVEDEKCTFVQICFGITYFKWIQVFCLPCLSVDNV